MLSCTTSITTTAAAAAARRERQEDRNKSVVAVDILALSVVAKSFLRLYVVRAKYQIIQS